MLKNNDVDALRATARLLSTTYQSRPKLIMRNDTGIKRVTQFKGRSLCVAQSGSYVCTLAAQYGSDEKVYKAPADSELGDYLQQLSRT